MISSSSFSRLIMAKIRLRILENVIKISNLPRSEQCYPSQNVLPKQEKRQSILSLLRSWSGF